VRGLQALPPEARDAVARGRDVDVPEAVRDAADEALARGETHYTDRPGILPLREQVARDACRASSAPRSTPPEGVVITCGGTEARFVAVQQLLPRGGTLVALSHPERVAAACIVRDVTLAGPDADPTTAGVVAST
jgi:aspartate/methionine/tyrosine aminotransferase